WRLILLMFLCVFVVGLFLCLFLLIPGDTDVKIDAGAEADAGSIRDSNIQDSDKHDDNRVNDKIQNDSANSDGIKIWKEDGVRLSSVSSIEADLDCIDLAIAVSDDDDFHLSYELHCMNRRNPLSYNVENGVLKLTETDFKASFITGVFWDKGYIATNDCNFITLYVPSNVVLKSCIMNITDSDLTIRELNCNTIEIKAADSDISLSDVNISDSMKINTEDGDISMAGLYASGAVEIITDDGDITISDFIESGGAYIQAHYGDICLSSATAEGKMQIGTEDGDVVLTELGVPGQVEIDSDYGDITVRLQKESLSELKIVMDTEEGDISVSRSLGGKKSSGHYEREGSDTVYLKGYTEEGDISIQ
ncbi:MAG: DUF4097 domain-containing protein, partial [Lachnospiraceae bacterium]|nr:DUF4097 domain-containing protein [Lachnospiraceae bacterium]